ncbi:MAG: M48 family metalloprotease [Spirochaetaceae bacterium]|jgi:predicted Zn-dependent protease|nr:M48 family metalloprotease [Spirochaetaceae bacterium]
MKRLFPVLLGICIASTLAAQGQGTGSSSGKPAPLGDVMDALSEMDRSFETPDEPLTPEDDYYLGRTVGAQILHTYKTYTKDPELVSYLNKICQALVLNSPPPFNGYHVGILDIPVINAFATPGGHIFLTTGLVECADSEDALAAVIAHELAHIQLRHATAIIDDQRLANDLFQSADRVASIALRNANSQKQDLFNRNISLMVNTLFKNGFSQDQEFEADVTAVTLLRNAGYDPAALVRMLKILEKIQPLRPGGFNTTHPSPADRLINLKKVVLTGEGSKTHVYREFRFTFFQSRIKQTQ